MTNKPIICIVVAICLSFILPINAKADLLMSVSGKVVATDNGAGLSGVRILLLSKLEQSTGKILETKSREDGTFWLKDVPKGMYEIWARSEDPYVISSNSTVPVTVPDGKNVVGIGIKLRRGGAIRGKVVTSTGKPVPNATILGDNMSTRSDSSGTFLLKGTTPGQITLAVLASAIAAKGVTVTCEVGKTVDVGSVVLTVGAASAIRGKILDMYGNAVSGVIVAATSENASGAYTMSSSTGSFVITGLSASRYDLTIFKYGYEPLTATDVSVPSSNLTLSLVPRSVTSAITTHSGGKSDVEKMYLDNVIPVSVSYFSTFEDNPGEDGRCPEGAWIGTSIDFSAGIKVPGANLSWGGIYSIGGLACYSSRVEFGFSQICRYGGMGVGSVSLGGSGIVAKKACDARDILYPTTEGIVFGGSAGIHSGGLAFGWNDRGVRFIEISYSIGPSFPSLDWFLPDNVTPSKFRLSGFGVGRDCTSNVLRAGLPEGETLDLGI